MWGDGPLSSFCGARVLRRRSKTRRLKRGELGSSPFASPPRVLQPSSDTTRVRFQFFSTAEWNKREEGSGGRTWSVSLGTSRRLLTSVVAPPRTSICRGKRRVKGENDPPPHHPTQLPLPRNLSGLRRLVTGPRRGILTVGPNVTSSTSISCDKTPKGRLLVYLL